NDEEFFPLNEHPYKDFAVFTDPDAAKPQQKLARIGSKCANPLGLFDTAGNVAEMVLDPFHFSIGSRLHGAAGGFIIKGGSFRKSLVEMMPGRREEQPFFLGDGAFRSSDVGFRVALSGILTPQDRKKRLDQEWADLAVQQKSGQAPAKFSASNIEIDQSKDPIAEIERFVAMSADETEKKNLLFLREVIEQKSILLKEQEAETVKGIIHSALFTAESLQKYAIRRKIVLNELNKLEKMKDETVSQSILDSLESRIAKAKETIRLLDSATRHFVKFYFNRIRESQRYPEELFASQISVISQELGLEHVFSRSLKNRLDLFRSHVALYKRKAGNVSQQEIQSDLIVP
ncbi:MAG: SUMF1/EgtB/PvdO family nonheme iron enzyme, partial [Desulfobacterales bacterium]